VGSISSLFFCYFRKLRGRSESDLNKTFFFIKFALEFHYAAAHCTYANLPPLSGSAATLAAGLALVHLACDGAADKTALGADRRHNPLPLCSCLLEVQRRLSSDRSAAVVAHDLVEEPVAHTIIALKL